MLKVFICFIFFFLSVWTSANEVNAILGLKEKVTKIKIGEFYQYELVIVPFEIKNLNEEMFLKKPFLDMFHVSKIENAYISKENADAVVVVLNMALSKKIEFQNLYIWQTGEMNVPVELRLVETDNTELIQKEFKILDRKYEFRNKENWTMVTLFILFILLGLAILIYVKKRFKKEPSHGPGENLSRVMEEASDHQALEEIYLKRRVILAEAKKNGKEAKLIGITSGQNIPDEKEDEMNNPFNIAITAENFIELLNQ